MGSLRVEQLVTEAVVTANPKLRVEQLVTEVVVVANPDLRVEQFVVEALTTYTSTVKLYTFNITNLEQYDSKIQINKLNLHVLGSVLKVYPTEGILTLSQEASAIVMQGEIYEVSSDNTLELLQEATYIGGHWLLEEPEDTIELLQDITYIKGHIYEESADDTLVVEDLAEYVKIHIYQESAEDTIVLDQEAITNFFKRPGSLIQLVQTASYESVLNRDAEDTLELTDYAVTKGILQSVSNIIVLTDTTTFLKQVQLDASSEIELVSDASEDKYRTRSVASYLVLTQTVSGIKYYLEGISSDSIELSHEVSLLQIRNLSTNNLLILTSSGQRQFIADRLSSNTLTLSEYAFNLILKDKKYAILQAPYNTCLGSIVLPNPIFDDTEGTTADVILKRSMTGVTRTYVKTNKNRRLKYTFVITRSKGLELLEFIKSYGSELIMIQNWKGEVWKVNIVTNPSDFVQGGRWYPDGARTEINLEFEGERVN